MTDERQHPAYWPTFGAAFVREFYDHARLHGVTVDADQLDRFAEEADTIAELAVEAVERADAKLGLPRGGR